MNNLYKKAELLANVAIIILAILLGTALVNNYLLPLFSRNRAHNGGAKLVSPGAKISLADVDWARNSQTLLLVLSKGCRFCSESAPFYQRLVQETIGHKKTRLIAVLPQDSNESKKYLSELEISTDEIKQVSLQSVGVSGTPTLILVNSEGVVTNLWIGKLQADKEAEVISWLR